MSDICISYKLKTHEILINFLFSCKSWRESKLSMSQTETLTGGAYSDCNLKLRRDLKINEKKGEFWSKITNLGLNDSWSKKYNTYVGYHKMHGVQVCLFTIKSTKG